METLKMDLQSLKGLTRLAGRKLFRKHYRRLSICLVRYKFKQMEFSAILLR